MLAFKEDDNMLDRDDLLDLFKKVSDFEDCSEIHIGSDETYCNIENERQEIFSKDNILKEQDICKACKTDTLVYDDGAYFCHVCGEFNEIRINQEQEWRYYGDSDSKSSDPTRVGMPMNSLMPESSLGTVISNKGNKSLEYDKMRQYHSWNTMPYKERSLYKVYERLQVKAIKAGIPPFIIENAKAMYKDLSEAQISRGSNRRGLMASCIYISCKMEGVPRSAKEVADIYNLKVNEMTRGCKKFLEIMNLTKSRKNYAMNSSTPLNFIKRFASKLNLPDDIYYLCEAVAYMTTRLDIVDENTPPSIAAGSIFLVTTLCNLNITKKQISTACKISEVTISKCYKKLNNYKRKLLPKTAIIKYEIKL